MPVRHRPKRRSIAAVLGLTLVVISGPAAYADRVDELDIFPGIYLQLLSDPVHSYQFVASTEFWGASDPAPDLAIFDAAGAPVAEYMPEGVGGVALSDASTVLYVTENSGPAIHRLDLTLNPPTELSELPLTNFFQPHSVVYAGGALWVGQCLDDSTIEKVNASTGSETPQDITGLGIQRCPQFVDHPTLPNVFYAWGWQQGTLQRIDVSSGSMQSTATWSGPDGGAITDVAVAPGGETLVAAVEYAAPAPGAVALQPTTLVATGARYLEGSRVAGVSIAADGHVAVGSGTTVNVFPAGSATPSATWSTAGACKVREVGRRGVDFGPSDGVLFVKDQEGYGLSTFSHPTAALVASSIDVTVQPSVSAPGDSVALTGTLDVGGASDSGRTVELFHDGELVTSTITGSGGTFGFDVSPAVEGTFCYETRFEGIATATGARSSATVEVERVPSLLTLDGLATPPYPTQVVAFSGTLSFDDAAAATGSTVNISHTQDGFTYTSIGDAVVDAEGNWTLQAAAPSAGDYTIRARYEGTDRYAPDDATVSLSVVRSATNLTLTTSNSKPTFGTRFTLRAHIELLPGTTRRRVVFVEDLAGKAPRVVGRVLANEVGVARLRVRAIAIGVYTARYAGDARNAPSGDSAAIRTEARIASRMVGHYGVSGRYRLFHRGVVPGYAIVVAPASFWEARFTLQRLVDGAWRTRARASLRTNHDGFVIVGVDPRILPVGARFRIRAEVLTRQTSVGRVAGNTAAYAYFRITP